MSKYQREINLILAQLKSGDKSKQQELYNKTYNHLRMIALRFAVNKDDYEDILLEAYLRIFRYVGSVDLTKDGYNWMCKVVQNVAYDFNRKYTYNLSLDDPNLNLEPDLSELFSFLEEKIVDKNLLEHEINKLTALEKEIIYLKFWQGLTYSQIAYKVDSKKPTVYKKIQSIIKKIRKNLKQI